jgi:excisionase family DNA binding protein
MKRNASSAVAEQAEPWLNSSQAREHLGISPATLQRWVKLKKLTPKRTPGGEFRFRLSELDAVLV